MYSSLLVETANQIATITINRPDKLNALNKTVIEELGKAIDEVISDPSIQSAIITGSGPKAFVAGADISEFSSLDAAGGKALAQKGQDLVFSKGLVQMRYLDNRVRLHQVKLSASLICTANRSITKTRSEEITTAELADNPTPSVPLFELYPL